MKNRYCPFLWHEIFINEKGNVYNCCHYKPGKIGNIYQNRLEEIVNSSKAQEFRKQSLNGKLSCYKNCTLLAGNSYKSNDTVLVDYSKLSRLKILFGEGCNISCVMCWQNHKSSKELDMQKMLKNLDLTPFEQIDLQGGEPLFLKSAREFFKYSSRLNKKVSFVTNGTIMNREWAELIAQNSFFINVSLNASTKEMHEKINRGSKWHLVLRNIQLLKQVRDELNTKLEIAGHMTVVWQNVKDIPGFIRQYREFGFDRINFGFDPRVPVYLHLHPKLKKTLKAEIAVEIEKQREKKGLDLSRLEKLGLV